MYPRSPLCLVDRDREILRRLEATQSEELNLGHALFYKGRYLRNALKYVELLCTLFLEPEVYHLESPEGHCPGNAKPWPSPFAVFERQVRVLSSAVEIFEDYKTHPPHLIFLSFFHVDVSFPQRPPS
jgi:hypothetical protein